jgi:hypothetical protein
LSDAGVGSGAESSSETSGEDMERLAGNLKSGDQLPFTISWKGMNPGLLSDVGDVHPGDIVGVRRYGPGQDQLDSAV